LSQVTKANLTKALNAAQRKFKKLHVINCAGVIKPRIAETGVAETIIINSVFPRLLADTCEALNIPLIHITTDCVFSGKQGFYKEDYIHDPTDIYGKSKSLGEPENCSVIRTSIIGEEPENKRSLLEWVKSQKNRSCKGFSNHLWNGVTCLQLAKVICQIIKENSFWSGCFHVYSPTDVNKYELLGMINEIYELDINIEETKAAEYCNRILRTHFPIALEKFQIPELRQQIQELKEYKLTE